MLVTQRKAIYGGQNLDLTKQQASETKQLTDYAIEQLGDIVFIELPEVGSTFSKNEAFATIESVKAASEIYMPISGEVVEINEEIVDSPELLNDESYENKWFVKIKSYADQVEFADLMDYSDYKEEIE